MNFARFATTALAIAVCAMPLSAATITWGFQNITNNDPASAAIGEAQLFVDITDEGLEPDEGVGFIFRNTGPEASVIAQIYFDDGPLSALERIDNSHANVNFVSGATPPNLPGGNEISPAFSATPALSAQASNPAPQNGVGPNQFVGLFYSLQGTQTFADVLSQLNSGALRIGIHVQAFAEGTSESFVAIPEPGFYGLLALMLSGVFLARRKFVFARN